MAPIGKIIGQWLREVGRFMWVRWGWAYALAYFVGFLIVAAGLLIPQMGTRLLVVVGVAVALLGLYGLSRLLFDRIEQQGTQSAIPVGLAVYLGGYGFIIQATSVSSGFLSLVGTWLAGLGLGAMTVGVRGLCKAPPLTIEVWWKHPWRSMVGRPGWWTIGGIVVLGLSVFFALGWSQTDWVLVASAFLALLALAVAGVGLDTLADTNPERWSIIGFVVIATSVVILVALLLISAPTYSFVPAALMAALGLIPLSKGAPLLAYKHPEIWKTWGWWATLVLLGGGLGAVATVSLSGADWSLVWTLAVVSLVLLFVAALIADVVELALILVLGAVLTGVLIERTDRAPLDPHEAAAERLVVFGDSYISGEGATRFFAGTNVAGDDECRRASTSYAYIVADELSRGLDFYACSGAKTFEVVDGAAGGLVSAEETQLVQFTDHEDQEVDPRPIAAVLISVGGNDSWFGTVGQACLGPGTCDVHRNTMLRNVTNNALTRIRAVYRGIKEAVGEDVPIVAMPYPLILTETGCEESPLTRQEHQFLFEFTEVLNDTARVAAANEGIHWFAPGITAYEEHRICEDGEPAVNVIDVQPKEGVLAARVIPTNWVHGSAHPNEFGHELMAALLKDWLEDLLASTDGNPEADTEIEVQLVPSDTSKVSTRSLAIPNDTGCSVENLPVSVETVPSVLGLDRVRFVSATVACHSQPDGEWLMIQGDEDVSGIDIPGWGREAALDFDPNRSPPRQVVIWESKSSGQSRIAVYEYCELDPNCADDEEEIKAWMAVQISRTAGGATFPVLLIFLGAWFAAVAWKRWRIEESPPPPVHGSASPS